MVETIVAVVSLVVSIASAWIAKSALTQAKLSVQEQKNSNAQAQRDWAQRKWFDLYFKVEQAHSALHRFQVVFANSNPAIPSLDLMKDHNELMYMFKEIIAVMTVFPRNPVLDELGAALNFKAPRSTLSKEKLDTLANAVESLRQKALIDASVLDVLPAETQPLSPK